MPGSLRRGLFICALVISAFLACWRPASAQDGQRYFPETGHVVSGEFLEFYERATNPLLVYGYPITDAFQDPVYGRTTQYFQKARFELYPNEPAGLRVRLAHLGKFHYEPGQPRLQPASAPGCRTYHEIEGSFQVCYAFLDFFQGNGGVRQFGYPISNLETHDGRIVQYFQNARFEWHPQLPAGQRVRLTDLGSINFAQQALDPNFLRPGDNLPQTILRLNLRAFPERPVTGLQGRQVIYVVVRDQNRLPVAGAEISAHLTLPAGETLDLPLSVLTDANGLARLVLNFKTEQPGLVTLQVFAHLNELQGKTTTSFRAWY